MVLVAIWETRDRLRAIRDGKAIGRAQGKAIGIAEGIPIGYAEGVPIGYAAANAAWRSWFYRREYAAANGLPFDEPMPTRDSIRARHPNPPPSHPA